MPFQGAKGSQFQIVVQGDEITNLQDHNFPNSHYASDSVLSVIIICVLSDLGTDKKDEPALNIRTRKNMTQYVKEDSGESGEMINSASYMKNLIWFRYNKGRIIQHTHTPQIMLKGGILVLKKLMYVGRGEESAENMSGVATRCRKGHKDDGWELRWNVRNVNVKVLIRLQ